MDIAFIRRFMIVFGIVSSVFDFVPLPPLFLIVLAGIVCLYLLTAELAKTLSYRRWS